MLQFHLWIKKPSNTEQGGEKRSEGRRGKRQRGKKGMKGKRKEDKENIEGENER